MKNRLVLFFLIASMLLMIGCQAEIQNIEDTVDNSVTVFEEETLGDYIFVERPVQDKTDLLIETKADYVLLESFSLISLRLNNLLNDSITFRINHVPLYENENVQIGFTILCDEEVEIDVRIYDKDNLLYEKTGCEPKVLFSYFHTASSTEQATLEIELKAVSAEQVEITLDDFYILAENIQETVRVNQVGYLPDSQKLAVFTTNPGEEFYLVDHSTNERVFTGRIIYSGYNEETDEMNWIGDFSNWSKPGEYHIESSIYSVSNKFIINDNVYDELLMSALHMLTLQRCGYELCEENAGVFAHLNCHDTLATVYSTNERRDFTGGWHDAGDYGRYTLTTVKTLNDLILSSWLYPQVFNDDTNSPDSNNGVLDILDEALVGIKWLKKMQMDWGPVHNAAVTSDFAWIVSPENDSQPVYILDDEPQTTAAVSGSFAMASMVFRDVDTGRADELLRDAKKAYEAFDKTEISVDKSNPWNIVAGDYKNNSILDEWFFAASALYAATHESRYLNDAMQIFLNDPNLEYGLTYSEMSGYGSFLLLQDEEFKQTEYYESLRNSFLGFANSLMSMQYENGYSVAAGSYYWGSNMGVANYSMIFLMANEIQSDQRLIAAAQQQISYLLGCNGMNMSYVTGYGDKYPNNIHHRLSMVKEQLLLGALVGGPDMGTGLTCPPAKCYVDQNDMYSMNEVAIYYNSPLIFSLAGIIAYK